MDSCSERLTDLNSLLIPSARRCNMEDRFVAIKHKLVYNAKGSCEDRLITAGHLE